MKHLDTDSNQTSIKDTGNARSVLVLGAAGGFGNELTRQMANQGWQVRAVTRKPRGQQDYSNQSDKINWIVGDLDQPNTHQTRQLTRKVKYAHSLGT